MSSKRLKKRSRVVEDEESASKQEAEEEEASSESEEASVASEKEQSESEASRSEESNRVSDEELSDAGVAKPEEEDDDDEDEVEDEPKDDSSAPSSSKKRPRKVRSAPSSAAASSISSLLTVIGEQQQQRHAAIVSVLASHGYNGCGVHITPSGIAVLDAASTFLIDKILLNCLLRSHLIEKQGLHIAKSSGASLHPEERASKIQELCEPGAPVIHSSGISVALNCDQGLRALAGKNSVMPSNRPPPAVSFPQPKASASKQAVA